MKIKEQKFLFGLPSWSLSLLTALSSLIFILFLASLLGSILKSDEDISEWIAYITYDILITTACFSYADRIQKAFGTCQSSVIRWV